MQININQMNSEIPMVCKQHPKCIDCPYNDGDWHVESNGANSICETAAMKEQQNRRGGFDEI